MKHKMIVTFQLVLGLILISGDTSAKPLDPADLESLLPPTPRDKNETIAAVVQDPVVQDAVHNAASNGSLDGLVVKKKVYIMPANDPNTILSKTEHLLVVPTENLEDVRRNITEAKQAEVEATESSKNLSLFEGDDGYTEDDANELPPSPEENTVLTSEKLRTESEFLEDTVGRDAPLPEDEPEKMAVPIVAVIDPSNVQKDKVNTPIVAILPNKLDNDALAKQVQFLKDNSDKIQKKTQSYIEQTSLTFDPDYWNPSSEISIDSPTRGLVPTSLSPEQEASSLVSEQVFLAPVVVPRWEIVAPIFPENAGDYSRDTGDMDVAEDIIFRPLFRYRQELQEKSRYANRRRGYRPYRDYDYPRRGYYYRSRYDDY